MTGYSGVQAGAGSSGQFMDAGFGGDGSGIGSSLLDGDGFGGLAAGGEQQAPSDRFSALRDADKERKLSPKVLAWQEKQKERIAKKGTCYCTVLSTCTCTGWMNSALTYAWSTVLYIANLLNYIHI